ncbi:Maf family protein [Mahella australiensis]|uniref:dTTP/UTP pyrophosphatase n=1 Tax=Mahella australiensis (strain DSM 15567 / CIP 107919 / 50-1 BON) TaxID=697281 RepID=F3ZZK7_MAHA5|nr:Maf family protein [Mahella australiensis]AEE96833.1 maf protein [Mahella australiensis 50-1 BON]
MKRLILASASPRREWLLKNIGLQFETIPSNVNEDISIAKHPKEVVMCLAMDKARDVYDKTDGQRTVIAADTVVVKDDRVLGKPKDEKQAFDMLKFLQGGYHEVCSGIAVLDSEYRLEINDCEITYVKMSPMDEVTIKRYIASGEPMDKAGAYAIQGKGAVFIERVEGCYYNVVGLPIFKLFQILGQCGITAF